MTAFFEVVGGLFCPRCGTDLEVEPSPFVDGGDFFRCPKCDLEGYGYFDQDRYHVSFEIPFDEEEPLNCGI